MADKQKTGPLTGSRSRKRSGSTVRERPTIAFFGGLMDASLVYEKLQMWRGISQAVQSHDANLFYMAGGAIGRGVQSTIYDLIDASNVDGIVSWNSFATTGSTREQARAFFDHYRSLPVVNIELELEGIPGVLIDNTQGMRDVLAHLIDVHGYRRIVYFAGATGSTNILRRQAFHEIMTGYGLYDPRLDCTNLEDMLRDLRPGTDYQAIVTSVDSTAVRVIDALRARGLSVPGDVAITGFNDSWEARVFNPPLTTARLPFYEMGRRAVDLLMDMVAGKTVPEQVLVPLELVTRRSCGCVSQAVADVVTGAYELAATHRSPETALPAQRKVILAALHKVAEQPGGLAEFGVAGENHWCEHLLDAFIADVTAQNGDTFVLLVEKLTHQIADPGGGEAMQAVVSTLRQQALPFLGEAGSPWWKRAEDLCQQARVLIGEITLRTQMHRTWLLGEQSSRVSEIGQALTAADSIAGLTDVLARNLSVLDVPSGYLALYQMEGDRAAVGPAEWSRLVLAFDAAGRIDLEEDGRRFVSREMLPVGLPRDGRPFQFLVQSLDFEQQVQGFALFELYPPDHVQQFSLHDVLRMQIGNALHIVLLLHQQAQSRQEAEQSRQQLQMAVRDLQAAQRQRLGQQWAEHIAIESIQGYVLSGDQAGPTDEEWLPVMSEAVEQGKVVVQDGDLLEPALAVPLTLSGQTIGVLGGVQAGTGGWSENDLNVAQTIVEQIALALETQRLQEEQRRARLLLDQQVKALNFLNELGRRIEENIPLSELMDWLSSQMPAQMQHPELCRLAVRLGDRVYGTTTATDLPDQIAQGLRVGGELVGQIYVAYVEPRDFVDQESALLGDVARRISGYIESRRLLDTAQASAARLGVLYELAQTLSAQLDMDELLDQVYRGVSRLLDATNFYVALYDAQNDEVSFPLAVENNQRVRWKPRRGGSGLSEYVIRNRQPCLIRGGLEQNSGRFRGVQQIGQVSKSWVGAPIVAGDQVLGVMAAQSEKSDTVYDERDLDVLNAVASQASVAIQNARLFEQTEQRVRQLAVLNELGRVASGLLDSEVLLRTVYEQLGRIMDAAVFFAANLDRDTGVVSFPLFYDGGQRYDQAPLAPTSNSVLYQVLHSSEPSLILRTVEEIEGTPTVTMGDKGRKSASLMYAPLIIGEQVVGAISVQSYELNAYTREDLDLLAGAASQVTAALQSALLFEQTQQRARREQLLRQIAGRVRGSTDPDVIVRAAVRELGTALGRRTFVRLGSVEALAQPPGQDG